MNQSAVKNYLLDKLEAGRYDQIYKYIMDNEKDKNFKLMFQKIVSELLDSNFQGTSLEVCYNHLIEWFIKIK